MTIYKFSPGEKKPDDNVDGPEVIVDLLKVMKEPVDPPIITTTTPAMEMIRRRRRLLYLLILLAVLTFISSAAVGGVYLYQHFRHRNVPQPIEGPEPLVYGVNYFETPVEEIKKTPHGYLEEKMQLFEVEGVERIEVPQFDDCESSLVVHDFINNYTAIVDRNQMRCFVMKLNRSQVVPPRDIIDLVTKLWNGHYTPKVRTLREKYVVFPRPVEDASVFGKFVGSECRRYTTFELIKYRAFFKMVMRRMHEHFYGYYAFQDSVIKIEIHG